jgi:ribosomal protein S19
LTPIKYLFERIEIVGVKVEVCNDNFFFNVEVISRMDGNKLEFVIVPGSNKRID